MYSCIILKFATILRNVFGVYLTIMNDPKTDRPFCIPYSMKQYGHMALEV